MAILIWWLTGLPPLRLEKLFNCSNCISSNLKPTAIFLDIKTYLNNKWKCESLAVQFSPVVLPFRS